MGQPDDEPGRHRSGLGRPDDALAGNRSPRGDRHSTDESKQEHHAHGPELPQRLERQRMGSRDFTSTSRSRR